MSAEENLGVSDDPSYDRRLQWKLIDYINRQYANSDVSQLTKFESNIWDLRKEGAPARLYLEAIVGGTDATHLPLLTFIKCLMLAMLGLESVVDRSGRTVYNIITAGNQFFQWLAKKGFLVSECKGGYIRTPDQLVKEDFSEFFGVIDSGGTSRSDKFDKIRVLKEWWALSRNEGMLPPFMRLSEDPTDGMSNADLFTSTPVVNKRLRNAVVADAGEEAGWVAIPLEYAFPMADAAASFVENYGESLKLFHEVVYEGVVQNRKSNSVSRSAVLEVCAQKGITLEQLGSNLPFEMVFNQYRTPSNPKHFIYKLYRKDAERCIKHMKRAVAVIILFTTGMRSRELVNLKVGCCVPDLSMGVENFYRMTVTIFKTSREYVKGQVITIPVPEITYKAVKVLEALNSLTRNEDLLFSPMFLSSRRRVASDELNISSVYISVKKFAEDIGLEYQPHPHQFRKTIAGWFVLNSPVLGPLLVMRLFSHKSLAMTEMYLKNNPFIRQARQEMLLEQSLKIVTGITQAAQHGKLAGPAGERLLTGINSDPVFQGLTEHELGATMGEYLRERAVNASIHFLLTPLAICVFNPEDTDEKPCARLINLTPVDTDVGDSTGLPLVEKCVGVKCTHCLVTECESKKLEQSLSFYSELIAGAIKDDYAQNLHLMRDARQFVELYTPVLEKVK
ncbi:tyrosine-type recombinase/integrase [Pseudomonas tolaasii]|uniref:tyrosine-type recombinase/integrase n=1 Tax=Pseudomonas tolaasii TaxID=29442 RepID=UPI001C5994FD|nr:tyrosine-type recombinase/integrase [Pseudomonas tolaasii]MBW1247763.1 tyrosine-type recombinase/integrase [Pseudomonas tolaasii]